MTVTTDNANGREINRYSPLSRSYKYREKETAKAHRLPPIVGRREVASYETHGRVYFAEGGGRGGVEPATS
jgi:hypothetical protein